jgi:N-terminal acetyltransferase B complex catalytic subunit
MTSMRRFSTFDLLKFNNVNLDPLTETYNMGFYLQYLAKWPQYCFMATGPGARPMGYVLGKAEDFQDKPASWHGHVTAVTVPPEYRRLGMATRLMEVLERVSELNAGYFVDLFVRKSNALAIGMYSKMGYIVYREVIGYYSGEENAYDMRKALPRDVDKKSIIPLPAPVHPHELD